MNDLIKVIYRLCAVPNPKISEKIFGTAESYNDGK